MSIRITSTLDLGGDLPLVFWNNLVTSTNVQAEEDPSFPTSNVANPSTSLIWKHDTTDSPVSAIEYFNIDLASDSINYVAIAGHNFGTGAIAVGLELASYNSPVGDADIVFDADIPVDDSPLIFLFEAREVERVTIRFVPSATAAQMAVVYAGTYAQFDEGIQPDHTPLPIARLSDVISGKSENGAFLGRIIIAEGLSSTAVIANMSNSFLRDEMVPFLEFASESPFFWAWNPETNPDDVAFAWLENDPQPVLDVDGYWSVDLQMRGIAT